MYPRFSPATAARLTSEAERLEEAAEGVVYPDYYLRHAHFLPGGYLSETGARWYERAIRPIYYQLRERAVASQVVQRLREYGIGDAVELGCGPGRMLAALAKGVPAVALTGVELSPRMLREAGRRLRGEGADPRLIHVDAAATPLEDETSDAIVACHLLGHVPTPHATAIVAEARRILRPGGWFVTVEHAWHDIQVTGFEARDRFAMNAGILVVETYVRDSA